MKRSERGQAGCQILFFGECAGRTALFRGLRAGPHSGRRDVSDLLKAATRRRTPKCWLPSPGTDLWTDGKYLPFILNPDS